MAEVQNANVQRANTSNSDIKSLCCSGVSHQCGSVGVMRHIERNKTALPAFDDCISIIVDLAAVSGLCPRYC